jgi:hypothetical protein
MTETSQPVPSAPSKRTNAVVDEETQRRCFTVALEYANKPWSIETQPPHIRAAVNALVSQVESRIRSAANNPREPMRPLHVVQAMVALTWLSAFHAGRQYEVGLAKAKRIATRAALLAAREHARQSEASAVLDDATG